MPAPRIRKDGQPDRRFFSVHARFTRRNAFTLDRHQRWLVLQQPNPAHVAALRAGIEQFRRMLEKAQGS